MEKKTTTVVKTTTTKKNQEPTLLEAVERVAELSCGSKMSNEFYVNALADIKFLSERFGVTLRQAVLFCVCMEQGPSHVDYRDIASHLRVSKVHALSYSADIDALARKHQINSILYGEAETLLPVLDGYCRSEQLDNGVMRKKIGF
ncbi:MAG: hypothetical protein IJ622_08715 [Bacteroidales bacterium]|nr:hypothetical protein [Bacteroidales bacterium]